MDGITALDGAGTILFSGAVASDGVVALDGAGTILGDGTVGTTLAGVAALDGEAVLAGTIGAGAATVLGGTTGAGAAALDGATTTGLGTAEISGDKILLSTILEEDIIIGIL